MISKLTKIFIRKQQVIFKETEDEKEFLRRRREYVSESFLLTFEYLYYFIRCTTNLLCIDRIQIDRFVLWSVDVCVFVFIAKFLR